MGWSKMKIPMCEAHIEKENENTHKHTQTTCLPINYVRSYHKQTVCTVWGMLVSRLLSFMLSGRGKVKALDRVEIFTKAK